MLSTGENIARLLLLCQFKYDPYAYQRGLIIDKRRGNLLKLDRHKYVKVAYHGTSLMPSAERKVLTVLNGAH